MRPSLIMYQALLVLLMASLVISLRAHSYYNCSGCHSFTSKASGLVISDVRNILIDKDNEKIYIAARDLLLRLDPSLSNDKSTYEYLELPPSDKQVQACINSGNARDQCSNYMRLLIFDNDNKVFACGTYATQPRCWRVQRTSHLSVLSTLDNSDTRSPSFPDQNVSGVITDHPVSNGYLFTGLNIGSGTRSSAIYREAVNISLDKSYLKTMNSDLFFKDANFVSSYAEADNFVYFFWREKAIESQNMEVQSRVGRICSYDKGALFDKVFTSFTKSGLSCTVAGKEDFAYNHLYSTFKYITSSSETIYGIFTTPESGLVGSAVCAYSFKAIQSLFDTSKYLEEVQMNNPSSIKTRVWKSVPPPTNGEIPGRPQCNSSLNTKAYRADTITFAFKHPLLAESAQPLTGKPLIVMPNIRITQIVVDQVKALIDGKIQTIPVMFLATVNGTIYKVAEGIAPDKNAKIVEQIDVFKVPRSIKSLKLYKNSLYVGCTSAITKVLTHRCNKYTSCRSCVEIQDPYCGWSDNKCTTKDSAGSSSWIQDVVYGKFNNICPEEPPSCSVRMTTNNPGGTTVLQCLLQGIPVPIVTQWMFNERQIKDGPEYSVQDLEYSQSLSIYKFGLKNLGEYECTVQNNKGQKGTCKMSIKGTLPVVSSGFTKHNGQTVFWCEAKGIPQPIVRRYKVIGGLIKTDIKPINKDSGRRSYYCVAQNKFGLSMGQNFTLEERKLDVLLKLVEEEWEKELKDTDSSRYKELSGKVKDAIRQVYSNNTAFVETTRVTFREGSVLASVYLRFVCESSKTDTMLLKDLQSAVLTGMLGSLKVEKTKITKELIIGDPVPTVGYRTQDKGVDYGLFVVAILVAIVLSIILGFFLGVRFRHKYLSYCGPKKHDSSIEEQKNIQSLKYTKSPTFDSKRTFTDEKLLNKREGDGDRDSIGSSGGRIHIIIDPSSKTPEKKVLVNGKVPQTC